jgi:hypothetical protein
MITSGSCPHPHLLHHQRVAPPTCGNLRPCRGLARAPYFQVPKTTGEFCGAIGGRGLGAFATYLAATLA